MTVEEKAASIISKVGLWWPLAEEDQLRQASAAYERVAKAVLAAAATGTTGAHLVSGGNTGRAFDAVDKHWSQYDGDCRAGLPATAAAAAQVATALSRFAKAVDNAKHKIINLAIEIGATLAVGAGLALFTFGGSAAAAAARTAMLVARGRMIGKGLSTVAATIVTTLLAGAVFGTVEGFLSGIVAQLGKQVLSDGKGISLSETMSWTAFGAAAGPLVAGAGLAARSGFNALRNGDNFIANRVGPNGRSGSGSLPGTLEDVLDDLKGLNPSKSKTNCVKCSIATDDSLAGKPLATVPDGPPGSARELERLYGGTFQNVVGYDQIKRLLFEAGPGARLIVSRVLPGRGSGRGHVFNGYVDETGHVKFVDGQTGRRIIGWPPGASYQILWTNKP